jgi:hypothetical protein
MISAPPLIAQALRVQGGNITMTVTTGVAGGQPASVTNSTTSLRYRRQAVITKITVQTTCPGQRFNLSVIATAATGGTAQPTVNLLNGMAAVDFITNIPSTGANNKTATLRYTASSTFAQGNSTELGNDVHTVLYTLLVQ